MYCVSCGSQVPTDVDARFCVRCGHRIVPTQSALASPVVGSASPGSLAPPGSDAGTDGAATRTPTGDVSAAPRKAWSPAAAARQLVGEAGAGRFVNGVTMEQFLGGNWRSVLVTV